MDKVFAFDRPEDDFAPWPIDTDFASECLSSGKCRIEALAKKQFRNFPHLNNASLFGVNLCAGYAEGPTLFLEDHLAIELMPADRAASHEYRMLGLAQPDDYFLISRPRIASFEKYLNGVFKQRGPTMIEVDRGDMRMPMPLAAACFKDEGALSQLAAAARNSGTLNICPYLSTGHEWLLGAEIAKRSNCPVQICAPLPQLSRRVNDKLWFVSQVKAILGKDALPPTYAIYGPIAAAAILQKLAKHHRRLVAKLPASAGSLGNLVIESDWVCSLSLKELRDELLQRLHAIGWQDRFPILVGVWEVGALASPSAQVWVPQAEKGPPIVEGIFGQSLSGDGQAFAGATRLALPPELDARFRQEALEISYYFQCLGYVGCLSMDALLTGQDFDNAKLHWIECNGRWGGVSIPMKVARRLPGWPHSQELLIVQRAFPDRTIAQFDSVRRAVAALLYSEEQAEGIIILEPTDQFQQNVTFLAIARSKRKVERIGSAALQSIITEASILIS